MATCFWESLCSSSRMALMREAEEWGGGERSSGATYPGLEVSRRVWGVPGSCSDVLGIWNTGDEEYSGNDNICGIEMKRFHSIYKEQHSYSKTLHVHDRLTASRLLPGLEISSSERYWAQLDPDGPDTLRPTPGYNPIRLDKPTCVSWCNCAPIHKTHCSYNTNTCKNDLYCTL